MPSIHVIAVGPFGRAVADRLAELTGADVTAEPTRPAIRVLAAWRRVPDLERDLDERSFRERTPWLPVVLEHPVLHWSVPLAAELGYTAVFATSLALVLQVRAQRHMSSARAALIFCFEAVFAALAAWVWFGERLSATQWLGGGLILASMVIAELRVEVLRRAGDISPPN